MQFLNKYDRPVERYKNRWIFNFFRLLIHTRKIKLGKFEYITFEGECNTECKGGM